MLAATALTCQLQAQAIWGFYGAHFSLPLPLRSMVSKWRVYLLAALLVHTPLTLYHGLHLAAAAGRLDLSTDAVITIFLLGTPPGIRTAVSIIMQCLCSVSTPRNPEPLALLWTAQL